MKKIIFLLIIINSAFSFSSNTLILKTGFSLEGQFKESFDLFESYAYEKKDFSSKAQGNQLILGVEYLRNFSNLSIGFGINREQDLILIDSSYPDDHTLYFIPIYGTLRYYLPYKKNTLYLKSSLGINIPCSDYKNKMNGDQLFESLKYKKGLYYSIGIGLEYSNNSFIELNYSVLEWERIDYDRYSHYDFFDYFDIYDSILPNIKYSSSLKKVNFIFGYKFNF